MKEVATIPGSVPGNSQAGEWACHEIRAVLEKITPGGMGWQA